MSTSSEQQTNASLIEETRKQINRLIEEVAQLSEKDLLPSDYYAEFLKRVLAALTAPAAAVWGRTAQGNLQLQYQINMRQVGLDRDEETRRTHDELLRVAVTKGQPMNLPPHASGATPEGGDAVAGNPTDYIILIAPIMVDNQVAGLVEVWQSADRHPNAVKGFQQFLIHMADLASRYNRNHMLRQMVGQQQVWTQMEAFARQIHTSLNPVEVGYLIVNESRRLINCDRVSVAVRYGKRTQIEAVSGADVVEKRSNLIVLMRKLADAVMKWGEKLVFSGEKDDSLPPDVLKAMDKYLEESNSKLLVILPLRDDREIVEEETSKKPPRSALIMESFEPPAAAEQMVARLEVIGRHAASALYNSIEHRRIPMRFIWMPLAKVQEGLGGTARTIVVCSIVGVAALITAMVFVPYPLKMDANGKLMPETRRLVVSPLRAKIFKVEVRPGEKIGEGHDLAEAYSPQLQLQLSEVAAQIKGADELLRALQAQLSTAPEENKPRINGQIVSQQAIRDGKVRERDLLLRENNTTEQAILGHFWLRSPVMPDSTHTGNWTVLSEDFQDLTYRMVDPSEPIMRLGKVDGPWELELKIPQKHIGQVLRAFKLNDPNEEIDVDLLVKSEPTRTFKGKLKREKIGGQANPDKNEAAEAAEPVVIAYVRVYGEPRYKITAESLTSLRAASVPDATIAKLSNLKDKEFKSLSKFSDELALVLTRDELDRSRRAVLVYAYGEDIPPDSCLDTQFRFVLTDQSLESLRAGGVPDTVIAKLNPLKGQKPRTSEQLSYELAKTLAPDELGRYQKLILVNADTASNRKLLVHGTEVHSKIRCGNHALGYSMFYGVWEFFYEKVWFWVW